MNITFDATFDNYLKELRTPKRRQLKKRNRKIYTEPGKSVSANNIVNDDTKKRKALDMVHCHTKKKIKRIKNTMLKENNLKEDKIATTATACYDTLDDICNISSELSDPNYNKPLNSITVNAEVHPRHKDIGEQEQNTKGICNIKPAISVNVDKNLRISTNGTLFKHISTINKTASDETEVKRKTISDITLQSPDKVLVEHSLDIASASYIKHEYGFP